MALIYADSFDGYAATADLLSTGRWDGDTGVVLETTGGAFGGNCVSFDDDSDTLFKLLPASPSGVEIRIAFWVKIASGSIFAGDFLQLRSTQGGLLAWNLGFSTTDLWLTLSSFDDSLFPATEVTGSTDIDDDQWHHIEIYFKAGDGTDGAYKAIIDGITEFENTGTDTNNAVTAADFAKLDLLTIPGRNLTADGWLIDDLVIWDDSGSDFTGELGQHRMEALTPTAEGAADQFTPSAGVDNSAMVDDASPDGDSTYVESSTTGHEDFYEFTDMATAPTGIFGVYVTAVLRVPDFGTQDFRLKSRQSASEGDGATQTLEGMNYQAVHEFFAQDPDSVADWNTAGVGTAQFGIEVM